MIKSTETIIKENPDIYEIGYVHGLFLALDKGAYQRFKDIKLRAYLVGWHHGHNYGLLESDYHSTSKNLNILHQGYQWAKARRRRPKGCRATK